MSGHSKWATIHRDKAVADHKRGKIFTQLGRAITVAVREGGGISDPSSNFRLRIAIEKARAASMPKDNIKRALQRAQGKLGGSQFENITYEGYGPHQIGIIVECVTDNHQRTGQEVKNIFNKNGGSLARPGAVSYQFEKVGFLTVGKSGDSQELILEIMDIDGVIDVKEARDAIEIYTQADKLEEVKVDLESNNFQVTSAELNLKPKVTVPITQEGKAKKVLDFIDKLKELDDVQKVFANFDIKDGILKNIEALK